MEQEEMLDVVDEVGNPTGESMERTKMHQRGIRHRTSHVWIARKKDGRVELLLQKRCVNKDSYPGCYDISSAGHIPAGTDFYSSAVRELREELGVCIKQDQLIECGNREFLVNAIFHGREFHDNQISKVFLLWLDLEEKDFAVQKEEIDEVRWFDFRECISMVEKKTPLNCIFMEELNMLRRQISL